MTMDLDGKEAAILKMLGFFGSQAARMSDEEISNYLDAVEDVSLDAVERSCRQFREGRVERNNSFVPTPVELAINARQWDYAIATVTADRELAKLSRVVVYPIGGKPPPPAQPLGPIKLEVGGAVRDVSRMTFEQKEEVMRTGRMPDEAPAVVARLRKMTE